MAEEKEKSTIEKISVVFADLADMIGLGVRAVKQITDLASGETGKKVLSEADKRAEEIQSSRK
jgi:hypothetical protein